MYSIITYLSASRTLDFVIEGIEEYMGVTIISIHTEKIKKMIVDVMGRGVTNYTGKEGFGKSGEARERDIIYTVITRLELSKLSAEIEKIDADAFIVMHSVELGDGGLHTGQIAIFVSDSYVLSIRHGTRYGFAELRGRTEREPELLGHGPAYGLYALLDSVVDRYFPVIEALSDETEELEDRIFGGQTTRAQIEALYGLKRKLTRLKHAVSPLLEVTTKLHGGRVPAMCAGLGDYFGLAFVMLGVEDFVLDAAAAEQAGKAFAFLDRDGAD